MFGTKANRLTAGAVLLGTIGVAALMIGSGAANAQAAKNVSVEVRGMQVIGLPYGEGFQGLQPLNSQPGTKLAVLVQKPDGGIIEFDDDASELKSFADDKGTKLHVEKEGFGQSSGFGMFANVSEDGKACMISIEGDNVPAQGAASLKASGTLALKCASEQKTTTNKNVALKVGAKVNAGAIPLEISAVGKPQWGEGFAVTFKANQDCSGIAEVRFLDAAGNEIESSLGMTSTSSFGGQMTVEKQYTLKKQVDAATIEFTTWVDMQTVKVPFQIETGLGL